MTRSFRLAHLSDPHLGPLPDARVSELISKRVIGYVNWQRNRATSHTSEHLDAIVADLKSAAPDHIAVTGDLVNLALNAELEPARAWLHSLGAPAQVSAVPGNHDAYVPGSVAKAVAAWRAFMSGDNARDGAVFPYTRRRAPVAIIGLSSANASAPFMATGVFKAAQAQLLRGQLDRLGRDGFFRVVLVHHPPLRSVARWYKRLIGASRLRKAVREAGAELILHGHTHHDDFVWIDGRNGPVPVIGVPSASSAPGGRHPGGRYNLFDIGGEPGDWHCVMTERGFTAPGRPVRHIRRRRLDYSAGLAVAEEPSELPDAAAGV